MAGTEAGVQVAWDGRSMKPDETEPRKPYAKPQLTRVTLRPEEAVLAGCKNLSVGARPAACAGRAACSDQRRNATGARNTPK